MMNVKNLDDEGKKLLRRIEHNAISITTTSDNIKHICENALAFESAAVCVPPCYVECSRGFLGRAKVGLCAVIGYPYGYATTETKLFECRDAIKNGATELELFANIGQIKKRRYDLLQNELSQIRKICRKQVLKLIVDTAILTHDEQIAVCTIATSVGINYVTVSSDREFDYLLEDVGRLKNSIGERAKIKACGNITDMAQVKLLIDAGASRVGESNMFNNESRAVNEYKTSLPSQRALEAAPPRTEADASEKGCICEETVEEEDALLSEDEGLCAGAVKSVLDKAFNSLDDEATDCDTNITTTDDAINCLLCEEEEVCVLQNTNVSGDELAGLERNIEEELSGELHAFEDVIILK